MIMNNHLKSMLLIVTVLLLGCGQDTGTEPPGTTMGSPAASRAIVQ